MNYVPFVMMMMENEEDAQLYIIMVKMRLTTAILRKK